MKISPASNVVRLSLARVYGLQVQQERVREPMAAAANTTMYRDQHVVLGRRYENRGPWKELRRWYNGTLRMDRGNQGISMLCDEWKSANRCRL